MSLNEFAPWQCPLCGAPLAGDVSLKCARNHSFDRAKEGYWHLLPVQSMRTKAPGDSKEMVAARRAFLNAGYYGIFGQAAGELCLEYGQPAAPGAALHLLDAGCGEGWYDRCIAQQFAKAGRPLQMAGFDIAKPAVRLAAKALPAARYAVASSFSQPVRTGWADLLLNCFSPFAQEEFQRVLRPGGRMIYVVPGAEHLYQMKAVLYDTPYKNPGSEVYGLLILPEDSVPGTDIAPVVGLDDYIFDISITANRPDCQSVLGIAREGAAILGKPLHMPAMDYKAVCEPDAPITVKVEAPDLCPRYMAHYVRNIRMGESPRWMKRHLALCGLRSISNVVDITNHTLLEMGQPMHAFDLNKVAGRTIDVRRAQEGEKIVTLDEKEFTLYPNNLVICDAE